MCLLNCWHTEKHRIILIKIHLGGMMMYFFIGLVCFLVAGGAVIGSYDTRNFYAESVSKRTFLQISTSRVDNCSL